MPSASIMLQLRVLTMNFSPVFPCAELDDAVEDYYANILMPFGR